MPKRRIFVWTIEAVFVAGTVAGTAIAADNSQKVDAGVQATKQLLLLMDTDRMARFPSRSS
jgi:hypothetical protein